MSTFVFSTDLQAQTESNRFLYSEDNFLKTNWQATFLWQNGVFQLGDQPLIASKLKNLKLRNIEVKKNMTICKNNSIFFNDVVLPDSGLIGLSATTPTRLKICSLNENEFEIIFQNLKFLNFDYEDGQIPNFPFAQNAKDILGIRWKRFLMKSPPSTKSRPQMNNPRTQLATYDDSVDLPTTVNGQKIHIQFQNLSEGETLYEYTDPQNLKWIKKIRRLPNNDLSLQASMFLSGDNHPILTGDISYLYLFEKIPGTEWGEFNTHRWAVKTSAFSTLAKLNSGPITPAEDLSLYNVQIRMNIEQNVWQNDRVYGLSLGYSQYFYNALNSDWLGIGTYLNQEIPSSIGDYLHFIPYFKSAIFFEADVSYMYPLKSGLASGWLGTGTIKFTAPTSNYYLKTSLSYMALSSLPTNSLSVLIYQLGGGITF